LSGGLGASSSSDESSEDVEEVSLEAEGKIEGRFVCAGSSSPSFEESESEESDLGDKVVLEGADFVVGGTTFEATFLEANSSLSSESSESDDESAFFFGSAFFLVPAGGSAAFDSLTLVGAGSSLSSEECERVAFFAEPFTWRALGFSSSEDESSLLSSEWVFLDYQHGCKLSIVGKPRASHLAVGDRKRSFLSFRVSRITLRDIFCYGLCRSLAFFLKNHE
jgi:hypothetical protein